MDGGVVLKEVRQTPSLTALHFGTRDELKNSAMSRLVFLCGVLVYVLASGVFRDKDSTRINHAGCFRFQTEPPLAASVGQGVAHVLMTEYVAVKKNFVGRYIYQVNWIEIEQMMRRISGLV
jgi:hypothetical protein